MQAVHQPLYPIDSYPVNISYHGPEVAAGLKLKAERENRVSVILYCEIDWIRWILVHIMFASRFERIR